MTEKRFEINNDMDFDDKVETYELSCIVDNSNKTFYFVVDSIVNVESFVERLNELHEENEELRKAIDNCQFRTLDLLDYIKEKDVVTHQEIKDWWNSEVMK